VHTTENNAEGERLAVWFLGRTGSGKSSLAAVLESQLNFHVVSGGTLLRNFAQRKTRGYGRQVRKALNKGGTLPDPFVIELYDSELRRREEQRRCLDGNPRNLDGFNAICSLLARYGYSGDRLLCFHIRIDRQEAERRLSSRRFCPTCRMQTTMLRCEDCKTDTVRRTDDASPQVLIEKHRWFDEDVVPVIDWLDKKGWIVPVEAAAPLAKVSAKVVEIIERRFAILARRGGVDG
jgi:adenylate kinase family enzyme